MTKKNRDFNRLRDLGFNFREPVDEYSSQPDSGSTIGGVRGAQEYGIEGGISVDDAERDLLIDVADQDLPYSDSALPPIEDSWTGVSEWSLEHAQHSEEILADAEEFFDAPREEWPHREHPTRGPRTRAPSWMLAGFSVFAAGLWYLSRKSARRQ